MAAVEFPSLHSVGLLCCAWFIYSAQLSFSEVNLKFISGSHQASPPANHPRIVSKFVTVDYVRLLCDFVRSFHIMCCLLFGTDTLLCCFRRHTLQENTSPFPSYLTSRMSTNWVAWTSLMTNWPSSMVKVSSAPNCIFFQPSNGPNTIKCYISGPMETQHSPRRSSQEETRYSWKTIQIDPRSVRFGYT